MDILPPDVLIEEGADVTGILGVIKYEPPVPVSLSGIMKGAFPSFIPKTDETRVQVLESLLEAYEGRECYITEKLDGASATFYIRDEELGVCSRNLELLEDNRNTYWRIARKLDLETKLLSLGRNLALQGELVGPDIQGNRLKRKGQQFFLFSIFLIDEYRYASFEELCSLALRLELELVPVLETQYQLEASMERILEKAIRNSVLEPGAKAEGIVIRVKDTAEHLSFKAINNEFLLQYGE